MIGYIIEFIFGLIGGIFMGITGIPGLAVVMLALDYFKVNEYKKILGAILFINLFPITVGSVVEFYKNKSIDFSMGIILLISTIIGGYMGSKLAFGSNKLSYKSIKYITAAFSIITGVLFYISAIYDEN